MKIKNIVLVRRENGVFHFKGKKIPAVRQGNGWGVAVLLEPSQVDKDFGCPILFLSEDDRKTIETLFNRSDEMTFEMLGRGWGGRRPFKVTSNEETE